MAQHEVCSQHSPAKFWLWKQYQRGGLKSWVPPPTARQAMVRHICALWPFSIFTDWNCRWEALWKEESPLSLYIFILKISMKHQSGDHHVMNLFVIHHWISVLYSWLPWLQLNTHPLPRLSWRKFQIPYHSSVNIYNVCVKDGNFISLTQAQYFTAPEWK